MPPSTTNNDHWNLEVVVADYVAAAIEVSTAAIVVVIDGGGSRIEPTAPMAALSTVAAVDGGGKDGAFITASH